MPLTIGDRTVKTSAVVAVTIINVTMWTEPAPLNQGRLDGDGQDHDVINVNQDTGGATVILNVTLVVIVTDVIR